MRRGDATRLFLLAVLARRGHAHGHELRREAQIGRTELWTEVGIGAIYSTLRRLEGEALIEAVRGKRSGQMPERTIYAITAEGRRELAVLRDAMLRQVATPADPFDLTFSFADELPVEHLRAIIEDRLAELRARISSLEHQRGAAAEHLDLYGHLLFDPVTAGHSMN